MRDPDNHELITGVLIGIGFVSVSGIMSVGWALLCTGILSLVYGVLVSRKI